jgi:hypothetical protein
MPVWRLRYGDAARALESRGEAMRGRLSWAALAAVLMGGCGSGQAASPKVEDGIALVTVRPTTAASLAASEVPGCSWCTNAFGADLTVESDKTLPGVNVWLDGWSGGTRCLYAQHDSPGDGFTLPAGQPMRVGFHQATVECAAPFTIDHISVRARSGDAIVFEGGWSVSLAFKE